MASTVSVPSPAVVCLLSVILAIGLSRRPVTDSLTVGLVARSIVPDSRPVIVPLAMLLVPVTAPVSVLRLHDEVIMPVFRVTRAFRPTPRLAIVDDALVASAVSVAAPAVTRPATLALSTDTGEVP